MKGGLRNGGEDYISVYLSMKMTRSQHDGSALHDGTIMSGFQQLPLAGDVLGSKACNYEFRNFGKSLRGQRQNSWSGSRQANPEKTRLGAWCHGAENLCEAWNKCLTVRLVNLVLHSQIYHVRVRWGGA